MEDTMKTLKTHALTVACIALIGFSLCALPAFASIAGSTFTPDVKYIPGATNTIALTCYNASTDTEWIDVITVFYVSNTHVTAGYPGGSSVDFTYSGGLGEAATAKWDGGTIYSSSRGYFTNDLYVDPSVSGDIVLTYILDGDGWGSEPHSLTNLLTLQQDVPSFDLLPAEQIGYGKAGAVVSYQLTLTNTMKASDSFDLSYVSAPWPASGPSNTGALPDGGSTSFTAQVTIQLSAQCGDVQTSTVVAVSTLDPSITNTASLVTSCMLLKEGFNAANLPAGWVTNVLAAPGTTPPRITCEESSMYPPAAPYEGSRFAKFNSFSCVSGSMIRLESPSFSTLIYSNINVNLAWFEWPSGYSNYVNEGVTVQWSTDGSLWNDVDFYRCYSEQTNEWESKVCSLPAGANDQSTLYVGFLFFSEYGWNCYLDDVDVSGVYIPEPAMLGALGLALLLVRRK